MAFPETQEPDPQQPIQPPAAPKQQVDDMVDLPTYEAKLADKYGVPKNLLKAMTTTESSRNTSAVSPKGAEGTYQVMPATFEDAKKRWNMPDLDPGDPYHNAYVGIRYLKEKYDQARQKAGSNLQSDNAAWLGAVAGYHGGGIDANGNLSRASDGSITTADHVKKVADRWSALENGDGIPDSQQQAQPAQQTASQAKKVKPSMKSQPAPDLIQQATGGNAASNLISSAIKNNPLGNTLYSAPAGPLVNNQPVQQFTPKQQAQATQEWENSRNQVKPVTREELRQVRAQKASERVRRQAMSDAMPVSPVNPLGSLPVSAAIPFAQTTASTVIPAVANVLKATGASVPDSAVNPIAQGLRALGNAGNAIRSDYQERAANIQEARESLPDDPLNKAAQLGGEMAGTVVPFGVAEMTGGPAAAHALNVASQDWSNPRQATRNALVNSALMATGNAAGRISGDIGQQVANRTGSDFLGTATNVAGRTGANALLAPALTGAANALDGKPNTADELTQQALMGAAFANLSNPSVRAQRARVGYVKDSQGNGTDIVPIDVARAAQVDQMNRANAQERSMLSELEARQPQETPVATVTTPEAPQTQPAAAGVKAPTPVKSGSLGRNLLGSVGAEETGPMEQLLNNSAPRDSSVQGVNVNQEATNRPNAKPVQESAPFTKTEQSAPIEQGGVEILSPDSIPAYEKGKRITKMTIAGQDVLVRIPKGMHPEEAQIRAELQLRQGKGAGNDVPGSPVVQSEAGNPAAPAAQETDATLQAKTPEEAPASLPARPVEPAPESTRGNVAANETAETAPTEIKPAEAPLPVSKEVQSNAPEQRGVMGSPEAERVTGEKPVAPVAEAGASPRAETGASEEAPANVSRSSDIYRKHGIELSEDVASAVDRRHATRESEEKGSLGKLGEFARKALYVGDKEMPAFAEHPALRKMLGLPEIPKDLYENSNTDWAKMAQHTMDALAEKVGAPRSSRIDEGTIKKVGDFIGENTRPGNPEHENLIDVYGQTRAAVDIAHGRVDDFFTDPSVKAAIAKAQAHLDSGKPLRGTVRTDLIKALQDTQKRINEGQPGIQGKSDSDVTGLKDNAISQFITDLSTGRLSGEPKGWLGKQFRDYHAEGYSRAARESVQPAGKGSPTELPKSAEGGPASRSRRATASERVTPSESGRGDAEASVPSDRGVSAERAGQERAAQSGEPRTNEADNQKRQDNVDFTALANKQRKSASDSTDLLTAIRREGGMRQSQQMSGEVKRLSNKETGTTGLVNRKSKVSPDEMRARMVSEGLSSAETVDDFLQEIEGKLRDQQTRGKMSESDLDAEYKEHVKQGRVPVSEEVIQALDDGIERDSKFADAFEKVSNYDKEPTRSEVAEFKRLARKQGIKPAEADKLVAGWARGRNGAAESGGVETQESRTAVASSKATTQDNVDTGPPQSGYAIGEKVPFKGDLAEITTKPYEMHGTKWQDAQLENGKTVTLLAPEESAKKTVKTQSDWKKQQDEFRNLRGRGQERTAQSGEPRTNEADNQKRQDNVSEPKRQNFTQFATERGYPSDYDVLDHGDLGPSGKVSARARKAAQDRQSKRADANRQAHQEFEAAIRSGKVIDTDGKVTKEGLKQQDRKFADTKTQSRINSIDARLRDIENFGSMTHLPNGKLKRPYQREADALNAERAGLVNESPKRDSIPNPLDDEAFYEQQRRNQRKAQGEKRDSGYSTLPNDVANLINKAVKGATGKDISQIVDHFKTHADNFVAWGKAVMNDLGQSIRPKLKEIWDGLHKFYGDERGSITADGSKLPSQEELTKQAKGHEKIGLPADFDIRKYAKEADKILADSKIPDEKLNKAKDIFQRSIDAVNSGDGAALAKAQVELKDLLKNTTWVKAADFMRPLNATGEFSPVGRQGWIGWLTHPKDSLNAFRAATGSDEKAMEFLARQLAKPGMPLMKAAGLDLGMLNEINLSKSALSREENTTSRWPEKIPIAGKALGYIERFNKTFLEGQRINLFETYQKAAESRGAQMWEMGKDGKMVPSKAAKEIAKQINIISGRGDIPDNKIAQAVVDLGSVVAYSPRFAISRFQAADPSRLYRVYKQSPEVFKSVATDYVKQLAAYTALAGALKVAGFQVNVTDPDDPDFLKAKIGNFRVPIVQGGLQPAVRFAAKMVKRGYEISSGKGDKGRSGAVTKAGSDIQSFLRQKEAPMAGFLHDQVLARKDYTDSVTQDKVNMGTNAIGQPVSAGRDFAQHILPMYFLQTIESYQNGGPAVGAATGGMELFGLSSGYYDSGKYGESQADGMGKAKLKRDWSYAQSGYAPWNEGMEPLDKYHARVQRADKLYNDSLPALRETSYYQNADKATQRKMEETLTRRIADLSYEETPSVSKIAPSSIIGSEQTSEKRLKSNTKKRANRAW